jgi:AbrB family looped-hinge helix DNA binding protein
LQLTKRPAIPIFSTNMPDHTNMNKHIPPFPGKDLPQLFASVKVGERGQVVIPQAAREQMGIRAGDTLLAVGGIPGGQGLMLIKAEAFSSLISGITAQMDRMAKLLESAGVSVEPAKAGTAAGPRSVAQKTSKRRVQ